MTDYTQTQIPFSSVRSTHPEQVPELSADQVRQLAFTIAEAADDRKGADISILDVGEVSYLADYFVVVTGFSQVQVRAIARGIEDKVQEVWNIAPLRTEGKAEGSWVLHDYGDVIVHIFMPQERQYYNLEAFWGHAQHLEFHPQTP